MPNPYISLLKTAWKYARRQRKKYLLIYVMFFIANIIFSLNPVLFGWFIGKIQEDSAHLPRYTFIFAGAYFGLKLLEWCFHGPARIMERQLAFNLSRNFLQERYHQALHLPVKWHQDNHSGAVINRIRKAYEALKGFFEHGFMYLHAICKLLFSMIAMLYFSPLYGGIGIALGVVCIWMVLRFDKPFIKTLDEINEREHVVSATLFDSLSNIMTVITLRLEKSMENGLLSKVQRIWHPFRKNTVINEWKWFVADIMVTLIYCVIAVGYIFQHWVPGEIFYVAGLITLLGYVNQFTSVFHDVAWQYTDVVQYNTSVETASNISEAYTQHHRADAAPDLPASWQMIELKELSFSHLAEYDGEYAPQSLHQLHVQIGKGKKIALIGESGSGKSTLLAILRGLYEPEQSTSFLVDGYPLPLATLNETVTLFPQEPEIFENTIAYNVTLGLPFSPEEILDVCNSAHFSEVVEMLPQGLESDIREKGVNLSGGQKQRLALARGILAARDSQVLLLDEPTSSVDPKTESMIYEKMFRTFADKAIISSMHRLHLLPRFDYIYVLHQGRIVAEGTFHYLRANSPAFQELWKHQENK
ncbi:ABC-type multidrug transport system fused ATPase/permease subunit [Chitinophaga niastensis]|uniref:ABC-type multidrug transport system fused ATPase/permease subunit n=1 Tax=Chitinophaga niastensis TaxID=536980 RepID=A0A2P8HF64_CHINA|nr:ABC transporter ATP-binding protein [Chitinophaga niastensis]PSL44841.1 ABC-type multidrug transport system fused ATPase/permease subunit [Chitinophaga niastensis]